ncbi:hypothetical protein DAMA08_048290 [Martiniozyma asiatica (nom. inval.)]|nr:hypothetical protein DAMA08_048290 [Martiniozyma asiatica]
MDTAIQILIAQYMMKINSQVASSLIEELPTESASYLLLNFKLDTLLHSSVDINIENIYKLINETIPISKSAIEDVVNCHLYLEQLILNKNPNLALSILRSIGNDELKKNLSPLVNQELILTIQSPFLATLNWKNPKNLLETRNIMKENLLKLLPFSIYIPNNRLESLISTACNVENDLIPNFKENMEIENLLHGPTGEPILPNQLKHRITYHSDEVWFVKYSPNGKYLATGSKDSKILIFDVEDNYKLYRHFQEHDAPVTYLTWAQDSDMLVSISSDQTARAWSMITGCCIGVIDKRLLQDSFRLSCAQFLPHSKVKEIMKEANEINFDEHTQIVLLGSQDGNLAMISITSKNLNLIYECSLKVSKIHDMTIIYPYIYAIQPSNQELIIHQLPEMNVVGKVHLPATPTSIISVIHNNNEWLLLNFKSHSAILMNTGRSDGVGLPYPETLFRLPPSASTPYIVRGCVGFDKSGKPKIVIMGSSKGQAWIWGIKGNIIGQVKGHEKLVNCVSWMPNGTEWASGSDDGHICIWGI